VQVEHRRSHLASAFFASPFEEAALVSMMALEFHHNNDCHWKGNKIEVLDSVDFPHSVGIFIQPSPSCWDFRIMEMNIK
jgi:carbamoyltransferase